MQGKVLIVDAIATNRIVLKVKLSSAYYQVLQAATVAEAYDAARDHHPDLIITALTLPDGDAAGLCAGMAASGQAQHTPVLAIGNSVDTQTRHGILAAGAHDVMIKPVDDAMLLGRVRSLIRAHNALAEWRMRDDTSRALGLAEPMSTYVTPARVTLVCADNALAHNWMHRLRGEFACKLTIAHPSDALGSFQHGQAPDAFVMVLPQAPGPALETLRLISALRANTATRHMGLLVVQTAADSALSINALDLGADDLMSDGFDPAELGLRLTALLKRKRMSDQLRQTVRTGLRAAVFDPLTGLHNRRYAMPHLARITEQAALGNRPFAVMLADMDHFKRINDVYGHASGDAVLVETARRLRAGLRSVDMIARLGGEEFLVVMPSTCPADARAAATRLCHQIGSRPFDIPGAVNPVEVTVSIGLALGGLAPQGQDVRPETADDLIDRADKALYAAKTHGRNQVTLSRPAA